MPDISTGGFSDTLTFLYYTTFFVLFQLFYKIKKCIICDKQMKIFANIHYALVKITKLCYNYIVLVENFYYK